MNMQQTGDRLPFTNTGSAITSGSVVELVTGATGQIGIALAAIAATTGTGEVALVGVFPNITKNTGEAFVVGQKLYWDAGNDRLTGTASTHIPAGRAFEAAASAATTATLNLNRF